MTDSNSEPRLDITSRHEPVSDATRDYCATKAARLQRFNDRISRIQIIMDKHKEERELEMIVHVDSGVTFVAKESARSFRAGIDALMDKMERQLQREKEKRKAHKGDDGLRGADFESPDDSRGRDE